MNDECLEKYIVVITADRDGHRQAFRFPLNVPVAVARGQLEKLTDYALKELAVDVGHEIKRRKGVL